MRILSISVMVISLLTLALALLEHPSSAAGQIYISVGEARVKKSVLAFPDMKYLSTGIDSGDSSGVAREVKTTVMNDLNFTSLFTIQDPKAFIETNGGLTLESFRISDWQTIGSEFLIKSGIQIQGGNIALEMHLYDVLGTKQILGKRYVARSNEAKILAHTMANDIMEVLTGSTGIFFSKLLMVCDKTGTKEIWMTDFDGTNPRQLTHHKTLAFSPAWGPENKKIIYSLYTKNSKNVKNIDLYELDLASMQSRLLSNRKGINSGGAYSPDGSQVALTMSFLGNPEIFLLSPGSREVTRLTKSFGFDVDPAWSPDGRHIAFVSSRSGQPMVFSGDVNVMKNSPGTATRLTYAGKYNATPSWSPNGKKLAFAGFKDSHFDVFTMNADGSAIERLTKDEGNNEDPYFSPDGNFIVFSSNRAGQKNVYVITADGTNTRRLSFGLGNCVAPKWSHPAKTPINTGS